MPSSREVPTINDYIKAAADSVAISNDPAANVRTGSIYDRSYGPTAILWVRESLRDRDMFRAIHFDSASGADLTTLGTRYGVPRILDTYGVGAAWLRRSTAAAGAGTILAGTRILVGGATPQVYKVAADTPVAASATTVLVTINPANRGSMGRASLTDQASLMDLVFDPLFVVSALSCDGGTDLEQPDEFRGRVRETLRNGRVGYVRAMTDAARAAGAAMAVFMSSDYSGVGFDSGINVCYVGDAAGTGTSKLVGDVMLALESYRVLGCDMMILPMGPVTLSPSLSYTVWDQRSLQNRLNIETRMRSGIVRYFGDSANAFAYKRDGIVGAVVSAAPEVRDVALTVPGADATLSAAAWPAVLPRYRVFPAGIAITGP